MNGDSRNHYLIDPLIANTSPNTTIASFKQFSGEYDTASGFGLWLANHIFTDKQVPAATIYKQGASSRIKNILLCNVTIANNISLILVKAS